MIRWSPAIPAHSACPHRRLTRLLEAELGEGWILGASTIRPWASANFVGARHIFPCAANGVDRSALRARLAATEWRIPGHIVADIVVEPVSDDRNVRIEILTVED